MAHGVAHCGERTGAQGHLRPTPAAAGTLEANLLDDVRPGPAHRSPPWRSRDDTRAAFTRPTTGCETCPRDVGCALSSDVVTGRVGAGLTAGEVPIALGVGDFFSGRW